jgi:hypothetical protein
MWSIIDVKKVANCRPTHNQRAQYSGHTKYHCFKYQTLETPDGTRRRVYSGLHLNDIAGLIAHCHRCEDGRRGDAFILQQSGLLDFLRNFRLIRNSRLLVFADSAYPNSDVMISMFRGRNLPEWATEFNRTFAKVRVAVEWGYNQVVRTFAYLDWRKQLRIESMPVEAGMSLCF